MLWIKSLHIIFMVTWFSGLFYLPRIFVYHAMTDDQKTRDTFKIMERKLMIMTHIGAVLTTVFGLTLLIVWLPAFITSGWMLWKFAIVVALLAYHALCMKFVADFRVDRIQHSHKWFRLFNEVPVLFLCAAVFLVVIKPG